MTDPNPNWPPGYGSSLDDEGLCRECYQFDYTGDDGLCDACRKAATEHTLSGGVESRHALRQVGVVSDDQAGCPSPSGSSAPPAQISFVEARNKLWPDSIRGQFVGWMLSAANWSAEVRAEIELFLVTLPPKDVQALRSAPYMRPRQATKKDVDSNA